MGNIFSGCGAVELISSLLGVNQGLIPPAINCDTVDPACEVDLVVNRPRATNNLTFVNTNLTRHGQAAAVVIRAESLAG
jgi:3-oxoacyl-[acyl-carrier-protein] synthase II